LHNVGPKKNEYYVSVGLIYMWLCAQYLYFWLNMNENLHF